MWVTFGDVCKYLNVTFEVKIILTTYLWTLAKKKTTYGPQKNHDGVVNLLISPKLSSKGAVHKWRHPLREGEGSVKRWRYSISLFCKMGNKGEGGVKNFKKWMTSFVMTHCCWFSSIDQIFGKIVHVKIFYRG